MNLQHFVDVRLYTRPPLQDLVLVTRRCRQLSRLCESPSNRFPPFFSRTTDTFVSLCSANTASNNLLDDIGGLCNVSLCSRKGREGYLLQCGHSVGGGMDCVKSINQTADLTWPQKSKLATRMEWP